MTTGTAVLSPCNRYRYRLDRVIGASPTTMALIGVNPSTADATTDDATIRKDMGFARRHGCGRIIKGNKFAFRATDVRKLRGCSFPIGEDNDKHLAEIFAEADVIVVAWGPLAKLPPDLRYRWKRVVSLTSKPLMCFGTAQDGHPRHTLMLAYDTPLVEWRAPG
jgi:hypothetical protein